MRASSKSTLSNAPTRIRVTPGQAWPIARLMIVAGLSIAAVVAAQQLPALYEGTAGAQASATLNVTGVAANHSSARIYYQPVAGAKDYRVYEQANPSDVKYAGLAHLDAGDGCPGGGCQHHFATHPDGTLVLPYQIASGGSGGPQVL